MLYRDFGNTGKKISALGFGCMRFPEYEEDGKWYVDEEVAITALRKAYDLGVNYFDTAPYYLHGNSELVLGKALKDVRENVMFSTKLPVTEEVHKKEDFWQHLEKSLSKLDTPYIDFYHFWGINKKVFDEIIIGKDIISEAVKAKEKGLIRHISFSFHDDQANVKHIIDNAPQLETMLIQYNLLDVHTKTEEAIEYAHKKGLGVAVMGPVAGGRLSAPSDLYKKLTGNKPVATYELALKFVLGNKNVSCALSGMENVDMLMKNVEVAKNDELMSTEECKNLAEAMEQTKKFSELYCTGCNYCQPCPSNINIQQIFESYTYHNVYGLIQAGKEKFNGYVDGKGALSNECIDCGFCESKCPQNIKIRDELKRVENIMKGL